MALRGAAEPPRSTPQASSAASRYARQLAPDQAFRPASKERKTPAWALQGGGRQEVAVIDRRPYQDAAEARAVASLEECGGFALFMDMRTGKTPVSCKVVNRFRPKRLLITCPLVAIPVWEAHLKMLKVRAEARIVNWESLWSERKRLKRWSPDFIIGDETHRAKNRKSKQSKALRSIAKPSKKHSGAKWRLALTGTPQDAGPEDHWAQMDFVDPTLFGEWSDDEGTGFKERYLVYGGFKGKKIVDYQHLDEFRRKLATRYYRVELEDVKKTRTRVAAPHLVYFNLVESKEHYASMEEDFVVQLKSGWIRMSRGDGTFVLKRKRVVAPRVITQAMKLHQLSGGFVIDEDKVVHRFGDEKLEQTGALVCALGNVPVVIFVRFVPELLRVAALMRALGRTPTLIYGHDRSYVSGTPFDVAVVQIRSGISIDLSYAEEAIFHSWGHSYLDYSQASFRIRSYTSKRARYHFLIARGTIDEDLYQVVINKLDFFQYVMQRRHTYGREKKDS